jgi:hypothetical protein
MLAGTNKAWPYTTAAGNGGSTGTFWTYSARATNAGTDNGLFCNNCHVLNGTEHTRSDHNVACMNCHIRVPHGGKVSRLLAATGASYPGNMPARYSGNGSGGALSGGRLHTFVKSTTGSYSTSNCQQTGCSGHSSVTGETW